MRQRLGLLIALLALLVTAGYGALAYRGFVRQQDAQLNMVLRSDLERVTAILARPSLGDSFARSEAASFILQFIDSNGKVALRWGVAETLPPVAAGTMRIELGGRRYLVAQAPWGVGGVVRLAHDIEAQMRARADLGRSLIATGVLILLLALVLGLVASRRMLLPLQRVSSQLRGLDPASDAGIDYAGPNDEIGELAEALNDARAAVRKRREDERAFLLEVAHELAAPLTLVRHHLSQAERDHPQDGRIAAASRASAELLHTSQDLLVLARGELERPLDPQVFCLSELVARVSAEFPGIQVRVDGAAEVVGDPERLMQVVRNLVRNGVQAAGAPEKVAAELASGAGRHLLKITDAGPGLAEELIERIFEHGFSGRRGMGVGLTVARSIVLQHGGSLRVSSTAGVGTTFEVALPSFASRVEPEQEAAPA